MLDKKLTEEQVSTVWATLKKRYDAKVKEKKKSLLMKIAAKMVPMGEKEFMTYVTTVKKTIYYPDSHEIGHGTQDDLVRQVELAAHEFIHVTQNIGYKYLFSSARLAKHETDAFIATMEMHHYLTGVVWPVSYFLLKLKAYGVVELDLKYAEVKLGAARKIVKQGIYQSDTVKIIIGVLE